MNIKIFTHNDLDGIGCAVLGLLCFDKADIEYCGYEDINSKVKAFIDNKGYDNYDHVYITDISITLELAEIINNTEPEVFEPGFNLCESFTLIDHHPTALHLEKYWWCDIEVENELGKCSGTSLFYKHILQSLHYNVKLSNKKIKDFVETVRQYDTWEWKTVYKNDNPNKWNNLLGLYGIQKFVDRIINKLTTEEAFDFDDTDLLMLELDRDKKEQYFELKSKELVNIKIENYNVGAVFADQYISELGNYLAEKFTEFDFIALIGNKTVSYRGIKDNIDLGLVAKQFGGGGQPKASRSQIDKDKQLEYIKSLFK
ncbi:DHH family phosphoesterase [Clostridium sp. DJ247]|uniref:DHH family phosphoesterase n=1 Tax=Clostridium sp. DJ247 TaxID=2726188 RepID=UPI00162752B8|nr:hypothetical protein [Clostridium sp. DJ247]MBC2580800.1 hypothetical protein [Clostridium sp. DJ247]